MDTDCAMGDYCNAQGKCLARQMNGAMCTGMNQCMSGFCVDGACCDSPCVGSCQRCDVVGSGEAALALLQRQDYDAILCDVRMPGVDGPALFEWLGRHRPDLRAHIAFVTGDTLGVGVRGFIVQGFSNTSGSSTVACQVSVPPSRRTFSITCMFSLGK